MSCSNCFGGCSEIISDRCIKYTGVDIPVLGIKNGDSLSYIEQSLAGFLASCLDGSGIKPNLNVSGSSGISCELVSQYLPTGGDLTINDFVVALIKTACTLQEQVDDIDDTLTTLNDDYSIDCLTTVNGDCLDDIPNDAGTHAIVQAVITKLCSVDKALTALSLSIGTNYVAKTDIGAYIAAYLTSVAPGNLYSNKMIPFTAVEYYGSLASFNGTGAGTGLFDKIYLCNGQNGTPDKRGRVPVGAIAGMGSFALNPTVDPAFSGNPNYTKGDIGGANTIVLSPSQMPIHTHTSTSVTTTHFHYLINTDVTGPSVPTLSNANYISTRHDTGGGLAYELMGTNTMPTLAKTSSADITFSTTNNNAGGGASHSNIPPVLACYYIMYIP